MRMRTQLFGLAAAVTVAAGARASAQTTSDEVRAVVAEALADAKTRTSLLAADGGGAGHDGRFFVASSDGAFRLNIGGFTQFRYFADFRDDDDGAAAIDTFEPGFQNARTRVNFAGTIVDPAWSYKVEGQFSRSTGELGLLDAFVARDLGEGWSVQWGQFKINYAREQTLSPAKYLAVDQSVVNSVFAQTYSQGVQVKHQAESWRVYAGLTDGLRSQNTDFNSPAEADFALHARAEYAFRGPWDRFEDFTSTRGSELAGMLGGAVYYSQSANTGAPTDVDTDYLGYTADLQVEGDGWNIFLAGHGRHMETRGPVGNANEPESDDFGAVVQGGVRITDTTELYARWDAVFLDDDATSGPPDDDNDFHFLTFGVNEYFAGHAAKFSADVVWSLNETTNLSRTAIGGFPNTWIGLLGSPTENEVVVRLQFQLMF